MPDVVALAGVDALLDKARSFNKAGKPVHSMHIIEILLADPTQGPPDPSVNKVRLEALQLCLMKPLMGLKTVMRFIGLMRKFV